MQLEDIFLKMRFNFFFSFSGNLLFALFFPLLERCALYSKSSSHRGFPKKLLCACYFAFTFTGEEEEDGNDDDDELHSPPMLADAQ